MITETLHDNVNQLCSHPCETEARLACSQDRFQKNINWVEHEYMNMCRFPAYNVSVAKRITSQVKRQNEPAKNKAMHACMLSSKSIDLITFFLSQTRDKTL